MIIKDNIFPNYEDHTVRNEHDMLVPKIMSKSFLKEANKQTSQILKKEIGEVMDIKKVYCVFEGTPRYIPNTHCMEIISSFSFNNSFSVSSELYVETINGKGYIDYTEEIDPQNILFKIENLDSETIREELIKIAYLSRKVFLEGYRFVVELKNADIDIYMKLIFSEDLSAVSLSTLTECMSNTINEYNNESQKNNNLCTGLIHSYSIAKEKRKNTITYKIDLGSAIDIGLNYIVQNLSDSKLDIVKIEIKGI